MPYGSAKDLPTYQEMSRLITVGKLATLFVARDQRQKVLENERALERLVKVVDDFYGRLGARNWIFHDLLNVDEIEAILAGTSNAAAAEERLIELYRATMRRPSGGIGVFARRDGLRERYRQIERAKEHYDANQFSSCVLQLIAVMDGYVNDLEPRTRRGLAARDPDQMVAWDSVVGHHMGLTHVMSTFTKTFKKRVDDEVFEVFRHGIVHGSVVNFDNIVVATKAWNMLFAVTDWASATRKAAEPKTSERSWSERWSRLKRDGAYHHYQKEFARSTVTPTDPGFASDELVVRATEFLDAWEHGRWGIVAAFTPLILYRSEPPGQVARCAKDLFEQYSLEKWEFTAITRDVPSGAEIQAVGMVNDQRKGIHFRMGLYAADGNVAMPAEHGAAWYVAVWAPHTFFNDV